MTMDNKATEGIKMETLEELDKKWEEEISKDKIVKEGFIKIAINEEGHCKVSLGISSGMIIPIMDAIEQTDPETFVEALAVISTKNFTKSFSSFLNELTEISDDDSEEADGDDDESDSDSEDVEEKETPECE